MKFETKSVIIGRKKKIDDDTEDRPCFVSLFDNNDPHQKNEVPKQILEYIAHKIIIKSLNVNYLLQGNDLVINDLESIDVEEDNGHLIISGKQNSS